MFSCVVWLCAYGLQQTDFTLPTVAPKNFSHAAGKFTLSASATPAKVRVEEPITLTVRIAGQAVKYPPQRGKLQLFPDELTADFYVEDAEDKEKHQPEKGLWEFVYRLRPKRADVKAIPGLRLVYFAPDRKKFQTSFADEIPITVTEKTEKALTELQLKVVPAPPGFYSMASVEEAVYQDGRTPLPPTWLLGAAVAVPPLTCLVWYRRWRRRHPSIQEARRNLRSRAAQTALAVLEKESVPVEHTRAAVSEFLRQRFDLPANEPTPAEVSRFLRRLGADKATVRTCAEFFEQCDAQRFGPKNAANATQRDDAIRIIQLLEAAPCAVR
ncbi:MAG: hypothetical protein L0Y72_05810 [Gemmataceae bacterium]|nr:hypothetical protein [Gemmataceae bacterium]MCI0738540.1 hypothetical protein [Gemmataceae bacterium]